MTKAAVTSEWPWTSVRVSGVAFITSDMIAKPDTEAMAARRNNGERNNAFMVRNKRRGAAKIAGGAGGTPKRVARISASAAQLIAIAARPKER